MNSNLIDIVIDELKFKNKKELDRSLHYFLEMHFTDEALDEMSYEEKLKEFRYHRLKNQK